MSRDQCSIKRCRKLAEINHRPSNQQLCWEHWQVFCEDPAMEEE